jgi:OLD-like protein
MGGHRSVVLVEGESDRVAVEVLARRRGRSLAGEGVAVVAMGGVTNIGHYLECYGPRGLDLRLSGLCDAGEARFVGHRLLREGLGTDLTRQSLAGAGFFVCDRDLEDELLRALGVDTVVDLIAEHGDLYALRALQQQPAQRDRSITDHLHRFMGVRSGRKRRYAELMAERLDLDHVPDALDQVLAHA